MSELERILSEADMVLAGVGEEFDGMELLRTNEEYGRLCRSAAEAGAQWAVPYLNRYFLKDDPRVKKAYHNLGALLEHKNYFVITTCMDGLIEEAGLKPERITAPCGSFDRLQCSAGCAGSIVPGEAAFYAELDEVLEGRKTWQELDRPKCGICGGDMECNTLYAEKYLEEGYAESFERYRKWLQGTLNHRLCVLELGAGMLFANVLRFRLEKIVSLNQKAELIRVHSHLYQLPAELAGRGKGISQNAVDFMAEI